MFFLVFLVALAAVPPEIPTVTVRAKRLQARGGAEFESRTFTSMPSGVVEESLKVPTAVVTRRGENDWEMPQVRGMQPTQSRWFLESIPITSSLYGTSQAHLIPPESLSALDYFAESIPTSLTEDGLGSGFRLKLKKPSLGASAMTRLGSFGSRRLGIRGSLSQGAAAAAALDFVYHEGQENYLYDDSNGTPFNPIDDSKKERQGGAFNRMTFLPHGEWALGRGNAKAFGIYSRGDSQIPGPTSSPDGGVLKDEYFLGAGEWSNSHFETSLFSSVDRENYSPGAGSGTRTAASSTQSWRVGLGARSVLGAAELSARPQWQKMIIQSVRDRTEHTKWWVPLGSTVRWDWASWAIKPGILYHHVEYPGQARFDLFSPRVFAKREWDSWALSFTAGNFFRHPTMMELYGAVRILQGNAALLPERAWKFDAGISKKLSSSLTCSLHHFQSLGSNMIVNTENAQGVMVSSNIGKAWIWGTVADVAFRWRPIRARVAVTDLNTQNLSEIPYQTGKELPGRPAHEIKAEVTYLSGNWDVTLESILFGPVFLDAGNRRQMLSTHSLGARATWRTMGFGTWGLELTNLLDNQLVTHLIGGYRVEDPSTGIPGYPAAGRRIYMTWKISI